MSIPATERSILIISLSEITRDPRVTRQISALSKCYQVDVCGLGSTPQGSRHFFPVSGSRRLSLRSKIVAAFRLLAGYFDRYYWSRTLVMSAMQQLATARYDLIIANDVDVLPLALVIGKGTPVILDAHEYAPRQFSDRWLWRIFFQRYYDYLCRTYLRRAVIMFTVCQGIADAYADHYGVRPLVLTNAPGNAGVEPTAVNPRHIRLIHHGGAIPSRHLEGMISMFHWLDDRFTLDFMLMANDQHYLRRLKAAARFCDRIRFIAPVPMDEIVRHVNQYDVGLYLLPPVNFNHEYALPNKIFEYVQARVAVAIGPSPEMAALVRHHHCGIVAETFSPADLAGGLNHLTAEQIDGYKAAAHCAAGELCAEANEKILISAIQGVLEH